MWSVVGNDLHLQPGEEPEVLDGAANLSLRKVDDDAMITQKIGGQFERLEDDIGSADKVGVAPFDGDEAALRGRAWLPQPPHLTEVKAAGGREDPECLSLKTKARGQLQFAQAIGHQVLGVAHQFLDPLTVFGQSPIVIKATPPGGVEVGRWCTIESIECFQSEQPPQKVHRVDEVGLEAADGPRESGSRGEGIPRQTTGERLPPPLPAPEGPRKGSLPDRGVDRRSTLRVEVVDRYLAHLPAEQILVDGKKMEVPAQAVQLADPAGGVNAAAVGDKENAHDHFQLAERTSSTHSNRGRTTPIHLPYHVPSRSISWISNWRRLDRSNSAMLVS